MPVWDHTVEASDCPPGTGLDSGWGESRSEGLRVTCLSRGGGWSRDPDGEWGQCAGKCWDGVGCLSRVAWPPGPGSARAAFHSASRPQTERDVSVRQRAVDLLYAMCDRSNAQQIVAEMLSYLETADYSIREEIVSLKAATLPPQDFLSLECVILPWRLIGNPLGPGSRSLCLSFQAAFSGEPCRLLEMT